MELGKSCMYLAFIHSSLYNTHNFQYNTNTREQVPYMINPPKLLKDMSKEIRHAERFLNSLNPPKPERESKRKRKRPVNKDFVDYSLSPKSLMHDVCILYINIMYPDHIIN